MENQFERSSQSSSSNLIVNYLPQSLSDQDFHNLFAQIGPVKTCKIVRNKLNGYSYGFGFVDYQKSEDAQTAIDTYNGYHIEGKTLKVAIAKPSNSNHSKNTNVYIRGVPKNFDPDALENMFSSFGRLVQFRVLRDSQSDINKGVAFALYDEKENADHAIGEMNGKILMEGAEPLQVKIADDQMKIDRHKVMASSAHGRSGGPMYAGRPMFGTMGGNPNYRPNHRFNPMHKGAMGSSLQMSQQPTYNYGGQNQPYDYPQEAQSTLFVYNIGMDTDESSLYHLFAQYGNVEKVSVVSDRLTGKSKGYGFVTMPSYEEARYAIENLNNSVYGGKQLQVSFKADSKQGPGYGPKPDAYPKYGNDYNNIPRRYGGNVGFNPRSMRQPYDDMPPKRPQYQQQPFY